MEKCIDIHFLSAVFSKMGWGVSKIRELCDIFDNLFIIYLCVDEDMLHKVIYCLLYPQYL